MHVQVDIEAASDSDLECISAILHAGDTSSRCESLLKVRLLYQIFTVTNLSQMFTVGGLQFVSDFDSGNLGGVTLDGTDTFLLSIAPDGHGMPASELLLSFET